MRSDKAFKTRVVLIDRQSLLTEETVEALATGHGLRLLMEDQIVINPAIRFNVETFAPTEGFEPTKPFRSRLIWRDLQSDTQSKLLLSAPETVLAIAVTGEAEKPSGDPAATGHQLGLEVLGDVSRRRALTAERHGGVLRSPRRREERSASFPAVQGRTGPEPQPPLPLIERIERALLLLACFIEMDGDIHVPMYERFETELEQLRRTEGTKDRAHRLLTSYSRSGGRKAIGSMDSSEGPFPYLGL
jgi:hypothetical protein